MSNPVYSIVIPVYNSQKSLEELYQRIHDTFTLIEENYELILVEDGGLDNSWEVMKSLRRKDSRVKIFRLMRNSGQHSALLCGFDFAQGDFIITMDDDLQHPPEQIPKLIQEMQKETMMLFAGITTPKNTRISGKIGSFLFCKLMSIHGYPGFITASYRIMRKEVVKSIVEYRAVKPLVDVLIHRLTTRISYIEIEHHQRKYGTSTYTVGKLLRHFFNAIIYNTTLPLKAIFSLGLLCFASSFVLGIFYFIRYIQGKITVSGWTTLLLLMLFFFGVLSLFIGIIGQYLYRIIYYLGQPKPFTIREKEL